MLHIGEFARLGQVSPRMLRHYDETGLLKPGRVDPQTGYRCYGVSQLARLHRLLALRDLGFTLEQLRSLLDDELAVGQLRGKLRLRQAQIERAVQDYQARLRRVDAHLRALEGRIVMSSIDVAVKVTDTVRIAEGSAPAAGFGHENLNPVFQRLVPQVLGHLDRVGARAGMMVAWYEEPADDGTVVLHAGFDIADQPVPDSEGVRVVILPAVRVASYVHHGALDDIASVYEALVAWIEKGGYQLAGRSRELYHEWDDDHPERSVTELQVPIEP